MANSSIIGEAKNKIIKSFISDDAIVQAIDPVHMDSKESLVNKYIFNYHQNPDTIKDIDTFITVQVHIPQQHYGSNILIDSDIEIFIVTHEEHMKVNNVPKVTENRNDYLSRLIDNKLNGKSLFGIGKLQLRLNLEGSYQKNWLYRQMVFTVMDINDSPCELE